MPPLYVSYFTPAYAEEARGLIASLEALGLEHDVRSLSSLGSWEANCSFKPTFLQIMRSGHPGRPLVWLDADARVVARPLLFEETFANFAAHWLGGSELLSGTLYFAPTPAADRLLASWADACAAYPGEWDQRVLQAVLPKVSLLAVERLPPEYTWIDAGDGPDISRHHYGARQPVIVHRQASRRLREVAQ